MNEGSCNKVVLALYCYIQMLLAKSDQVENENWELARTLYDARQIERKLAREQVMIETWEFEDVDGKYHMCSKPN